MKYRLVVGERGNERGHIIPLKATSFEAASKALKRELRKGAQWGRVESYEGDEERGGGYKRNPDKSGEDIAVTLIFPGDQWTEEGVEKRLKKMGMSMSEISEEDAKKFDRFHERPVESVVQQEIDSTFATIGEVKRIEYFRGENKEELYFHDFEKPLPSMLVGTKGKATQIIIDPIDFEFGPIIKGISS